MLRRAPIGPFSKARSRFRNKSEKGPAALGRHKDLFHWNSGQSHGPDNLPDTVAELLEKDRKPYPGWTS